MAKGWEQDEKLKGMKMPYDDKAQGWKKKPPPHCVLRFLKVSFSFISFSHLSNYVVFWRGFISSFHFISSFSCIYLLLASCLLSSILCFYLSICVAHLFFVLCSLFSFLFTCVCVCVCFYECQIDRTYNERCVEMLAP